MPDASGRLTELNTHVAADLVRYATRLTGDAALAEDIVQEALLRAWRDRAILYRSRLAGRRWLFTVTRRLAIDQLRSAGRRHELPWPAPPEGESPSEDQAIADRDALVRALRTLPRPQRVAVVRVYLAGASPSEAAAADGVPVGTIKSRLHYGLGSLRAALPPP